MKKLLMIFTFLAAGNAVAMNEPGPQGRFGSRFGSEQFGRTYQGGFLEALVRPSTIDAMHITRDGATRFSGTHAAVGVVRTIGKVTLGGAALIAGTTAGNVAQEYVKQKGETARLKIELKREENELRRDELKHEKEKTALEKQRLSIQFAQIELERERLAAQTAREERQARLAEQSRCAIS